MASLPKIGRQGGHSWGVPFKGVCDSEGGESAMFPDSFLSRICLFPLGLHLSGRPVFHSAGPGSGPQGSQAGRKARPDLALSW